MIKQAMLWHRFRCSLSTTAAGANHMCKSLLVTVQVFVHFRRVTSFSCANAWMTTSIDRSNGGCNRLPLGSKLFHFHAVLGKKNCKIIPIWELAHPPWENAGYITLVYLVQGFEYEKIALLVWVAHFPNMGTTKFHASVTHITYDRFHWWYQCYQCYAPSPKDKVQWM